MKHKPLSSSISAKSIEDGADSELLYIPVGPLTVPLPESLSGVVVGSAPWPVTLSVSRVWIGRRDRQWELHFGEVEALPLSSKPEVQS